MAEWFETFFRGLYKEVLANQFDEATCLRQARLVKRLLKARKGMRVLDIPCGMGRLTIPLARTGLEMTGVDLAERFVRRARREARKQNADARFICRDMRRIDFEKEFDAAFNWFGSFGYFSDAEMLAFCRRLLRALKPGGRFLVEGMNKSWLLSHFVPESDRTIAGVRLQERVRFDGRANRVRATWIMSRGSKSERHRLSLRSYGGTEMRALLRSAGFREIELFGYPPLGSFTRHSRRLIAVARRPKD
jgi:SAM-dependent methyltransferase